MSLPELTIPFDLPFDLPLLLHPAIVHFAIAIPVVILLLEVVNLVFKKQSFSFFSVFLLVLTAIFMTLSYFTGSVDGKETFDALSVDGQEELKEHKLLGVYLTYAAWIMIVLKLVTMVVSRFIVKVVFLLLMATLIAFTLKQGKDGGELTYEFGANNQVITSLNAQMNEHKKKSDEEVAGLKGEVETLNKKLESALKEVEKEKQATQAVQQQLQQQVEAVKQATTEVATPAVESANATSETAPAKK
jgi:uncharacterized membrane protein